MGSGHILVYAFDVLVQIYKDAGHREKDCPELILKNNLFCLDIDDRAYQLAYFAVMMSAWRYNHRILTKRIEPNLCAIQESNGLSKWSELTLDMSGEQQLNLDSQFVQLADELIEKFQDAKEYGSILDVEDKDYEALLNYVKDMQENSVLDLSMAAWLGEVAERLPQLVKQAKIMGQKYDVVVTNPPYMGSNNMSDSLSKFVRKKYPASKNDLFACFIERCGEISRQNGFIAMITQHTWMFLSSFEKLRQKLLQKNFVNMVHLGARAFEEIGGEVVQTTSFVIANVHIEKFLGTYSRLVSLMTQRAKEISFLKRENIFLYNQENFNIISGTPIAYWVSEKLLNIFADKSIDSQSKACIGMRTGDNERFLRLWFEIDSKKMLFKGDSANDVIESEKKWIPYNKGGEYRKWYGNQEYVVNWEDNGFEIKENTKKVYPQLGDNLGWKISNEALYFKPHICWTDITTKGLSFRIFPNGFIFDASVNVVFTKEDYFTLISYLNSKVVDNIAQILNPTLHFKLNNYNSIPMLISCDEKVKEISKQCVDISRTDWNSYETAWNFKYHPLLNNSHLISDAYENYKEVANSHYKLLKSNEEELNRIFIDIYGLSEELTPEVAEKDVTVARIYDTKDDISDTMKGNNYVLTKADVVKSLLSYAVGCMFGRYSLDEPGLIMAGGEFDHSKYKTFQPDEDAIIPICDDEYFKDDMVQRFCIWLKAAFGEEHYRENLQFIADALEGKGTPLETIRSYFLNDFYTDHCKRYQKRPIYWLFDAGKKNSFKALVYIHRYDKDTIARMRTGYVYKQQELYKTRIETTQNRIDTAASQADKNKFKRDLKKLREQFDEIHLYEEKIHHYADLRQEIDLDDGVKHNYALFEDVLAKIK